MKTNSKGTPLAGADLSPRQLDILGDIANGLPAKTIAARRGINQRTVEGITQAILGKLEARNQPNAVYKAMSKGIIQ